MRALTRTLAETRSFEAPVRLLMVNQLTINLGFYMLMPYLAQHLAGTLGLAAWLVALVLGVRNFSQQGMFLVGGTLADRLGYKPMIVAGCALRTAGFLALGLVDSLPALIAASAATGLAGALFNPAVRAYLAHDAGPRRVEAFALFNVYYQAGILLGPLVGLALTSVDFRLTCLAAAGIFALLSIVQMRSLPTRHGREGERQERASVLAQWRSVVANRPFLLFSTAMIGSYVLTFQVYLALPLEVRRLAGDGQAATVGVGLLFAVSALATIFGQAQVTAWCRARLAPGQALTVGLALMGAAFLPLLAATALPTPGDGPARLALAIVPPLAAAALLTAGNIVAYPFEMDTIVTLAGERLVATHYGFYNTISGIGITAGNLLTGAALDGAGAIGAPSLPWLALAAIGGACALAVLGLHRSRRLAAPAASQPVPG